MTIHVTYDFDLSRVTLTVDYAGGRRTRIYRFPRGWGMVGLRAWANAAVKDLVEA